MAKLTQAEIKAKADEWAKLDGKIKAAEAVKEKALEPFVITFQEQTAGLVQTHDQKIAKLVDKRVQLEDEVVEWLEKHGKPIAIGGEMAVAANETKVGSRTPDARKFFDLVQKKDDAFWSCISILVAKAEKVIGADKLDSISSKSSKLVASLKMK